MSASAAQPATSSIAKTAFVDFETEMQQTRRLLERIPDDRLDWRPHEKSWTLGMLATHVAQLPFWALGILQADEFDLAGMGRMQELTSSEARLAHFDGLVAQVREALAATTDGAMMAPWTLKRGDHVIFSMPRLAVLRTSGLNHIIHHRAQLTIYLRMLDVPVPGLYGPSADEK